MRLVKGFCRDVSGESYINHRWIQEDEEESWNISDDNISILLSKAVLYTVPMSIERIASIRGSCHQYGYQALHLTCTKSK